MSNTPRRILITGSSGFIGASAMTYFLGRGHQVLGTDIRPPADASHAKFFEACDLNDAGRLTALCVKFNPDWILHLGARTDVFERTSINGYSANMDGIRNVIAAANNCPNLQRIIITSSRLVCRVGYIPSHETDYCPPNFYGESKVETERITRSAVIKAEWVITRPTAIWGPGFQIPSYRDFFEQVRRGRYFHLGDRNPRKTFGYIGNFCFQMEGLLAAPANQVDRKTFFIGDYTPVSLREWADSIAALFGRPPIRSLPLGLLRVVSRVGDVCKKLGWDNVPLTTARLDNMLRDAVHDETDLEAITGPLPYDLATATRETVEWLKRNPSA